MTTQPHFAFVLFNWFPHGGLQQDLVKLVRACQPGAALTIYTLRWDGEQLPGVETVIVPVTGWTATARRRAFAAYIQREVSGRYTAVIGFNRLPGLDWYFAADSCFVARAAERSWLYRLTPRVKQYLAFEQAVFGATSKTRILLLSPQQREQYQSHYGIADERLHKLPPGITRAHCAGQDADLKRSSARKELGIGEHELLVLQVGSGFNTKGVTRSLLALALLPAELKARTHYVLIGRDDPQAWLFRAKAFGLKDRVRILPPRDDIARLMQGADLLLHPSLHESAGMVLLEAVVAGLPVLTTAACGYAFHVETAQAGVVLPEPFEQGRLNHALRHLLQSDRSVWRDNGILYGQTQDLYDMPQTAAKLLLAGGQA
jgi:UDP-glucose:(heptosyl)LPS alpha-1,3-glucosyltransferase